MKLLIGKREAVAFFLGVFVAVFVTWTLLEVKSAKIVVDQFTNTRDGVCRELGGNTAASPAKVSPEPLALADRASALRKPRGGDTPIHRITGAVDAPASNYDMYSEDELRLRSRNADIAAMLALSERLFADGASLDGHNEGFDWLDEAGARGSTQAVKLRAEELLKHVTQTQPDLSEAGLSLYQEAAAYYLVAAMMMGDKAAIEEIPTILPAMLSRQDVSSILRGGYGTYQKIMAHRAYLGLPPYVAEFPPYDVQGLIRAANLGREDGG